MDKQHSAPPVVVNSKFGFYQLSPIPKPDELEEFYESQYYDLVRKEGRDAGMQKLMSSGEENKEETEWVNGVVYRDLADYIRQSTPGNRLLDIGAGTGSFVSYLNENGFDAEGIDPARLATEIAQDRGVNVHFSSFNNWHNNPDHHEKYDAISLLNVLEHLPNPEQAVISIQKLLKPGGVLCIKVPNDFNMFQKAAVEKLDIRKWWIVAPDHINYFTFGTLRNLLEGTDYQVVLDTTDFPIDMFLLMGDDYISRPETGKSCHQRRKNFELALSAKQRQKYYANLSEIGLGRCVIALARKRL